MYFDGGGVHCTEKYKLGGRITHKNIHKDRGGGHCTKKRTLGDGEGTPHITCEHLGWGVGIASYSKLKLARFSA